ncbi:hypothetical protein G6F46_000559 [Rhizopus delemar]|uniref:Acyl carrier protein n=3 Tax=Rhizopus TaxID=4842 RepID=I1CGD4_RHIO9|nr:hypothetical protein RO3G_12225 [Rhizopus delemar RA 99-880]KAG1464262.1 hypothetical protein G6F55_001887 [Rhizopus delemar]KAG1547960.1 hypothetical protein G6F51_003954 [Rhizopus arrhizus]KAG1501320.1 hypothetical protein G6F54_003125 [Rhizopus delemar]KAG1514968.1 hypothetical protein G6F53_003279 [Rhizopus delemar]|eukprot:EIE87514.1 hypothetical protein RO3G_12225 [Rhizopus delemar RA 99-880]
MVFYPRVILSAASRSAQRPLMTRMVAPALMSRMYASAHGETVESRTLNILKGFDKVNPEKVTPQANFIKDLGLDSLDTVEVVMAIEEEFSVEIPDNDADAIQSVQQAVEYISKREDAH